MASALLTADTSVVVPFLAAWHPLHADVRGPMTQVHRLPGHVLVETVSTLTRLPGGHAVAAGMASRAVLAAFPAAPLSLTGQDYVTLVQTMGHHAVTGGAAYDALVAHTARAAGAHLLTRDRRAERTYRAVGVDFEMLG